MAGCRVDGYAARESGSVPAIRRLSSGGGHGGPIYAWFKVPSGSCLAVVSTSPGALIVIAMERLAAAAAESRTSSVKLKFPAAVGVPLKVRVEGVKTRPAGKDDPEAMAHVYGGVPPVAVAAMRWL